MTLPPAWTGQPGQGNTQAQARMLTDLELWLSRAGKSLRVDELAGAITRGLIESYGPIMAEQVGNHISRVAWLEQRKHLPVTPLDAGSRNGRVAP